MWNWRMLAATGEARFTDVIERALYNGINSGMSLDGTTYCYRNPLAFDPASGEQIRNPWYDTTCCPPNLERTFASLPGYFYSTSKDGVYVHLYDNSVLDWRLENGTPLKIRQQTNYPWDGSVKLTLTPNEPADFTLYARIPAWAESPEVSVNGKPLAGAQLGQYFPIRRRWSPGDAVALHFPTATKVLASNPRVAENRGRVAVQRGPIVYCLEQLDQPNTPALSDVAIRGSQSPDQAFSSEYKSDLLDGVNILHHNGAALEVASSTEALYLAASPDRPKTRPQSLTLIPYFAWANRQPTQMQVWTPYSRA
jgi:uncharacterized protein